ncbi:metallophosphoesterase [Neptunomonas japonica]|uniref:metallophosphoesterase n=1 Tax=Neptunomonas japonica TaxID=417574 RepID=UPI00041A1EBC|nr:metallophosphoesterase [Neptunomonas japonica]
MLRIIQVTDCHLQASKGDLFKEENPEQRLLAVLEDVKANHPCPELLLLTGDLAHHGYSTAYNRLQSYTKDMAAAIRWIPGNHDDAGKMLEYQSLSGKVVVEGAWCVILLDSTSEPDGVGGGALSSAQLSWLDEVVAEYPNHYLLIGMHHPPVKVGSRWQDAIMLANAGAFWAHVSAYDKLKLVLCGHLHQEHQIDHTGVSVLVAPATAPQFAVGTEAPLVESDKFLSLPGYRVLDLFDDGGFETIVKRVSL